MSETQERRDKQIMIRLNEREYTALLGAAAGAERKVADMARLAMMRGLQPSEGAKPTDKAA